GKVNHSSGRAQTSAARDEHGQAQLGTSKCTQLGRSVGRSESQLGTSTDKHNSGRARSSTARDEHGQAQLGTSKWAPLGRSRKKKQ
uniref:Uncharacterized protein n=1 Tax=Anopheles atroparvus TaxID=41427 RepID=A0AAG5DT04_ANOAO